MKKFVIAYKHPKLSNFSEIRILAKDKDDAIRIFHIRFPMEVGCEIEDIFEYYEPEFYTEEYMIEFMRLRNRIK